MFRINLVLAFAALSLMAVGFPGCGKPSPTENQQTPARTGEQHDDHDHAHREDAYAENHAKSDMDKMKEGLAGLAEEDQASAMKQHFCPVSGQMLGTMGEPIKVTVDGQEVWVCCNGCKKDLEAEPEKYLAKPKK